MISKDEIQSNLAYFTGTENLYKHSLGKLVYTEGVKYLCDSAECYWFLDKIAITHLLDKGSTPFMVWRLLCNRSDENDDSAVITLEDGNGNTLRTFQVEYTDIPLDYVTVWVTNNIALLPSEY